MTASSIPTVVVCPDPDCIAGKIVVHNAYSPDPLKGEEQVCDRCAGRGSLVVERFLG